MPKNKIALTLTLTVFIFLMWFIWPASFFITGVIVYALYLDAQYNKYKKQ